MGALKTRSSPRKFGRRRTRKLGVLRLDVSKTLAKYKVHLTGLLKVLDKASKQSNRTGQPVSVRVEVARHRLETFLASRQPAAPKEIVSPATTPDADLAAALEAARERGQRRVAEILSGLDMLNADDFAKLLGTNRVTINAKRRRNQVLALEGATRGFRYPSWQLGRDGKPFSALPILFERLRDSWAVYRFLVQHHPELDGLTGVEALQKRKADEVIEVAESVSRDFS